MNECQHEWADWTDPYPCQITYDTGATAGAEAQRRECLLCKMVQERPLSVGEIITSPQP